MRDKKVFLITILLSLSCIVSGIFFNKVTVYADDVPNTALKIENNVLYGFSDGQSQHRGANVVIPSNVTSIADTAFYNQEISSVDFTSATNLKSIGDFAFAKNQLTSVQYPKLDDNNLGWYIFYDNNITSLTFANGVTHINDGAFANNPTLKSVTFPKTITSIGDWVFAGDNLRVVDLTTIQNTNSLSVGSGAFYGNQSFKVSVLPNDVLDSSGHHPIRWYGYEAFGGGNTGQAATVATQYALKHQHYSAGTPGTIGNADDFTYDSNDHTIITGVKSGTSTLGKTIVIPSDVTKIANNAFESLGIMSVDFSKATNLKEIGNFAFYDNQISNTLNLPNSLNNNISGIGWYAFASNNIANVIFPNNDLKSLNDFVFADNKLTGVDLPDTLQTIGDGTFIDNQITDVNLPVNIQRVGSGCFAGNSFSDSRAQELTTMVMNTKSEKDISAILYPFGMTTSQKYSQLKNQFSEMSDGTWQYFGSDGLPVTGLQVIDGHTYYFNSDGTQVKGGSVELKDGRIHYFDANSGDMLN
ncbi:serine protease [Leuconostoc litchii]|uniref:Serine protease n=2 Tax=Leuconostoc litchii TaxID=1981069 RepID=A0A6P2CKG3_9LACO|nr:serine protease [Leuconostoc litchii]